MTKAAIVESGAAPQSPTSSVESDERHEDHIEAAGIDALVPRMIGFGDAVCIEPGCGTRGIGREAHAEASSIGDDRRIDLATALPGATGNGYDVRLATVRQIDRNATSGAQQMEPICGRRKAASRCQSLGTRDESASRPHIAAQFVSIDQVSRLPRREGEAPPACAVCAIALDTEQ